MEIKHSETVNVINEYIKSTLKLNSQYFSHFFLLESAVFFFGGTGVSPAGQKNYWNKISIKKKCWMKWDS